jgi:hypothetical protein
VNSPLRQLRTFNGDPLRTRSQGPWPMSPHATYPVLNYE